MNGGIWHEVHKIAATPIKTICNVPDDNLIPEIKGFRFIPTLQMRICYLSGMESEVDGNPIL